MPSTPAQSQCDSSRANGAKPHGPKTLEGRQQSAQNATRHGLFSQTLVLPHESPGGFDRLHASYVAKFQPLDQVEADLVDAMVAAKWRQQRVWEIETNTLEIAMVRKTAELSQPITDVTGGPVLAVAYDSLSTESKTLAQIVRAEANYSRQYDGALNQLLKLRKAGIVPASVESVAAILHDGDELQNEPKSQNEPEPAATAAPTSRNEPKPGPQFSAVQNEPNPDDLEELMAHIENQCAA